MTKAAAVALAITVPFILWNPAAFWRAVVEFQFIQPFRIDALSHLVWMHNQLPLWSIVRWKPFVMAVPAMAFALLLAVRSPPGFGAPFTLVNLAFVAIANPAAYTYYSFCPAT